MISTILLFENQFHNIVAITFTSLIICEILNVLNARILSI